MARYLLKKKTTQINNSGSSCNCVLLSGSDRSPLCEQKPKSFVPHLQLFVGEMSILIAVIAISSEGHRSLVANSKQFCQMGFGFLDSKIKT